MKKSSVIIGLLCSILCLGSCKPTNNRPSDPNFNKIELEYVKNGSLIELEPSKLYEKAITNAESMVVYYSIDFCADCKELSNQMRAYAKKEHTNIYWVNMTNISEEKYQYIYDASVYANDAYKMPPYELLDVQPLALPLMHIFSKTVIVLPINDSFVDKLIKYTTVTSAS